MTQQNTEKETFKKINGVYKNWKDMEKSKFMSVYFHKDHLCCSVFQSTTPTLSAVAASTSVLDAGPARMPMPSRTPNLLTPPDLKIGEQKVKLIME